MSVPRPPSFTPARPVPRPVLPDDGVPARPAPPRARARRAARRRRTLLGALAVVLLMVGSLQLTGHAPWSREPRGADALEPRLEKAVDRAIEAARRHGLELYVTSGLRSVDEQAVLWAEALDTYGSAAEAARWVLPPERSTHVQGLAVDVGPADGAAWLGEHGSRWGLCQVYANEPWHFERVTANKGTCPAELPDASVLLDR